MNPTLSAGQTWAFRAQVEVEVESLFQALAVEATDAPRGLEELVQRASKEERQHRVYCAQLAEECGVQVSDLPARRKGLLGPSKLSAEDRALYTAVALGCVTESLSAALLGEMLKYAEGTSKIVVHAVLTDEVQHARIGWGWLAWQAERRDISWLGAHLPAMIEAAVPPESIDTGLDLRGFGILPSHEAKQIVVSTVDEVIRPGLRTFGVHFPTGAGSGHTHHCPSRP